MSLTLAAALRTTMATAVITDIDDGTAAGTLDIYGGARPDGPDTAPDGDPLASITLNQPSFTVADGVATIDPPTPVGATGTGTAAWFRISDGDGNPVLDGNCGTEAPADLILASLELAPNVTVTILGGTITMPAGTAD